MEQASPLCGGVSLLHTVVDGEHQYKVKKVLTHTQSTFARKGDKILMINGVNTKDLPPKEFASMLHSRSPSLTIHQASIDRGINECFESDGIHSKEITLHFRMAMVREECLEGEENEVDPAVCEWESDYTEDDQELLLVSMNETSVAVRSGRGCDPENPCNSCSSQGCNLSEVVVVADSCNNVTSVGRDYIRNSAKKQDWMRLVQEFKPQNFLSVEMTIYYYITNILSDLDRGVPVVLNFTDSNKFLKCTRENGKVVLKSEGCDEKQLKKVCKDDEKMWPFVFYMKTLKDSTEHYESAAHRVTHQQQFGHVQAYITLVNNDFGTWRKIPEIRHFSRDDANHYKVKKWPDRVQHTVGKHNVKHQALVDPKKIYLPPLHIKLGLIKNFKAMDHNSDGFKYLKQKFGEVQRDAKLKAGIFDGPQVCELIKDKDLPSKHRPLELRAWESFVQVVQNFLGNHKATNYEELVDDMLISFKRMGCRMSLMIHFLHSHLDFFPPNLGDVSDEYGERFHQDISEMETRYQGHYNTNMMGDYCWFLQRETSVKRKSKCLSHF
ncbi:hypothetical protein MHYP_G00299530 [Metynnis hypsauchen]